MRILHVIGSLSPEKGGPSKVAPELCEAIADCGHHVTIYTIGDKKDKYNKSNYFYKKTIAGVEIYTFKPNGLSNWNMSTYMGSFLKKNIRNFEIVHLHSVYLYHTAIAAHYCRKFNIPYIIRPHGTLDPFILKEGAIKKKIYTFLIEQRNLDKASAIHYTAQEEMNLAHEPLRIKSPGVVVSLGVNIKDYTTLPPRGLFRSRFPELADKYLILFLGRINFKKGLDLLSKAFCLIAPQYPNAHLVIAGPEDEGYGNQVRQWLAEYGVLDRTTFTGMLYGTEKLSAFVDADLFVLPSYSENFGVALIEAMACGLPVIVSNKVNIWQELADANAGEVIECNVEQLQKAIVKIMQHPEFGKNLSSNGKKLAFEKFNWDIAAKQLCILYSDLISKKISYSQKSK